MLNWSREEGIKTVKKTFANFDRYNLPQNATKNSTICTIVIMVVEFQVHGYPQQYKKSIFKVHLTVTDLANSCATPLFRRPQGSMGCLEKRNHPLS